MVEYAIARLAAVKSRFIGPESLQRFLESRDPRALATSLSESVFKEEIDSLIARGEGDLAASTLLRIIHKGHLRLRLFFAGLAKLAFPRTYNFILARWELEELKAALRYLSSEGPALERRFRFTSYFADPKRGERWEENKTIPEFLSTLARTGHPLATFLDTEHYGKDRVLAELEMERRYFQRYIPQKKGSLGPARRYFLDRLDAVNIHNALLIRENPMGDEWMRDCFLKGPGAISFYDFQNLAKASSLGEARQIVRKKLAINLNSSSEDSFSRFSTEIRKAFFHRYRINKLLEPGGVWAFLFFMEGLDAMVEDLKLAVYFGAAGVPHQEAEGHFVTAMAA